MWLLAALLVASGCSGGQSGTPESDSGATVSVGGPQQLWHVFGLDSGSANGFHHEFRTEIESAAQSQAEVVWEPSSDPAEPTEAMTDALRAGPDLIIGVGSGVLDEFNHAAAEHLDTDFLIVDAVPPEPTSNLTTMLFDVQTCPVGAECAEAADVFDVMILDELIEPDVATALRATLRDIEVGQTGRVALYRLESLASQ